MVMGRPYEKTCACLHVVISVFVAGGVDDGVDGLVGAVPEVHALRVESEDVRALLDAGGPLVVQGVGTAVRNEHLADAAEFDQVDGDVVGGEASAYYEHAHAAKLIRIPVNLWYFRTNCAVSMRPHR